MRRLLGIALAAIAVLVCAAPAAAAVSGWRGIIEGSYGRPWSHDARMRMLGWMPAHSFTTYVHAPKDDLYQRALWREPYPAGDLAQYRQEIQMARAVHVQWIPNLSPAVPLLQSRLPPGAAASDGVCFSCPADVQAVVDKFAPFLDAGVRTVMISFDDVSKTFTHAEDTAAYGSGDAAFGSANATFLDAVYDALNARTPGVQLLTVSADYGGTHDTPYLQGLRSALRPAVQVMWTGTRVRSARWTRDDANAYAALIGRTPLIWENWTNNDGFGGDVPDGSARIFMGPYMRDANVVNSVGGFFFNPAGESDLNKLPLATAGDWLRDPSRYNPRTSWLRAIASLARPGSGLNQTLRAWAEASYSTKLSPVEGPTFSRLFRTFLGAYDAGPWWMHAVANLRSELWLAADARHKLARLPDQAFYAQAIPFLDATWQAAQAGIVAATLLEAERPALSATRTPNGGFAVSVEPPSQGRADALRALLQRWKQAMQSSNKLVYGWRPLYGNGIPPWGPPNVMDDFISQVEQHDAAWQPSAATAASSVALTIDGNPGPAPVNGVVRLSRANCSAIVIAQDGAGGQSSLRLPSCARR